MQTPNSSSVAVHEPPKANVPQVFGAEVQEFISEHGLESPLRKLLEVAATQFDLESPPAVQMVEDGESGDKWVQISVRARGDIACVRAAHRRYTEMLLGLVPPEDALKIRISIRIA